MNKFQIILFFNFLVLAAQIKPENKIITQQINEKNHDRGNYTSNQFILLTMLYNEKNQKRIDEYLACLEKNLCHENISEIRVFYDTSKDSDDNKILDFLKEHKIPTILVNDRVSFKQFFDYANLHLKNKKIILSNADIYFNDTLNLISNYSLENKFIALTRWEVQTDGSLEYYKGNQPGFSQDTWIFESPIINFDLETIKMGTVACDNRLSYLAKQLGLNILNPSLSVQCCHLHTSKIRNYDPAPVPKNRLYVQPTILD